MAQTILVTVGDPGPEQSNTGPTEPSRQRDHRALADWVVPTLCTPYPCTESPDTDMSV